MTVDQRSWPEQDRKWVARYRTAIAGKNVPTAVLQRREDELLKAVHSAAQPAVEVFGDAVDLAKGDASELATTDEAVRTSEGGGVRAALREGGGTLAGTGAVAVVLMFLRNGWYVDVELATALFVVTAVVVIAGWFLARSLFSAGRPVGMAVALLCAAAVATAGIVVAVDVGPNVVVASDVPLLALGVALMAPGLVALGVAAAMPPQVLQMDWDDAKWWRRFRGGLTCRLVPQAAVRAHVAEVRQQLSSSGVAAHVEFGHPLVLAREIAGADRTARARRWWMLTIAGTIAPLLVGLLILVGGTWGALTIPVGVIFVLVGLSRPVIAWGRRPWAKQA